MVEMEKRAPLYRRRPFAFCCCIALSIILLIVLILVILAFTVFKPKEAEITVSDVELEDLSASQDISGLQPKPSVNVTLSIVVTVHNPNRASMKYTNSSAMVYYYDEEVAIAPVPAGSIGSRDTSTISTTVVVLADRLATNSHLPADFLQGSLPIVTKTKLSGRVKVLFVKRHVDIYSECSITISITNKTVSNQDCKNKVHI